MGETNTTWTNAEEIQLCESWAKVMICPYTGKSITSAQMWKKIQLHFEEHWTGPTGFRTPAALQSHFKPLKKVLKEWHNAQIQTRHNKPSGTNQLDEAHSIQLKFMEKNKKPFEKHGCWDAVKTHPYFMDPPAAPAPTPTVVFDSPSETESPISLDDVVVDTPPSIGRPLGPTAITEARRRGKKRDEGNNSVANAILAMTEVNKASHELLKKRDEDRQKNTQKMLEFEEAKEDTRIMELDTSKYSLCTQQWFKTKRDRIRQKTDSSRGCYRPLFYEQSDPNNL